MTDLEMMLMQMEGTGPRSPQGWYLPYEDSVGKLTIGIGHLVERGLPPDIVMMQFHVDIADALDAVRHNCSCYDQLSRPRQLVLCSMGFQFGRSGLATWPRFLAAIHLGHWDEAADELLDSKVAREQAPVRFKTLARMMKTDESAWV